MTDRLNGQCPVCRWDGGAARPLIWTADWRVVVCDRCGCLFRVWAEAPQATVPPPLQLEVQ